MKYKVGDKVIIRKDLNVCEKYGGVVVTEDMLRYCGETVTIYDVRSNYYRIVEHAFSWTDEMFEPVEEELTAEETIKVLADMCARGCKNCELGKPVNESRYSSCSAYRGEHPDEVIEILKQFKKDHEKKQIKTEYVWYVQIVEVDTHILKHEEPLKGVPEDRTIAEVLKKWCSEHEGKYYAISERRCIVKE